MGIVSEKSDTFRKNKKVSQLLKNLPAFCTLYKSIISVDFIPS